MMLERYCQWANANDLSPENKSLYYLLTPNDVQIFFIGSPFAPRTPHFPSVQSAIYGTLKC